MAGNRAPPPPPDPISILRGHKASVTAVAFHGSSLLISGDSDGELKIWDMVKRRPLTSARVHSPAAGVIGIGSGLTLGNKIISQGRDGTVKIWQLTEGDLSRHPLMTIQTESYHFCKFSLSRPSLFQTMSGHTTASCSDDVDASNDPPAYNEGKTFIALAGRDPSTVEFWDIESGRLAIEFSQDSSKSLQHPVKSFGMCMALQVFASPNAEGVLNVIVGYEDGTMAIWDMRSTKSPVFTTRFHQEPVLSVGLDGPCHGGVSGAADDKTVFFTIDYQLNAFRLGKEINHQHHGIQDVCIRGDDKIVATAGWDHRVRLYDYKRRRPVAILKYHADLVNAVSFSNDCKFLSSASKDGTIALWSIYPPKDTNST